MTDRPLFSVMIANYNDGRYINEALASIARQSYDNYEVIIVDDGSTDDSKEILHSMESNPKYHIYYNDVNQGCGYTKRKCVSLANGDICGFLDADDALTDDALQTMVDNHIHQPDTSLVYSRCYMCNNVLSPLFVTMHQCQIPEGNSFLLYKRGAISHFVSFKKSYYDKTLGINPNFKIAEDLDLYFKLEEVGKTLFIDKPLYYYRSGTGNNTSLDKNVIKAAYWEIIAKTDACRRRNLNPEESEIPAIEEIVNSIVSTETDRIKKSREYKLGNYILHPNSIIKRLFHTR